VLDGVNAGALCEHPSGEDALFGFVELHLVHLDERRCDRLLRRRARVADPRRDFQPAEIHGLVDGDLQRLNARGDLVERGEHRDLVGHFVRQRLARPKQA